LKLAIKERGKPAGTYWSPPAATAPTSPPRYFKPSIYPFIHPNKRAG
jgi:hypothetical protein